MPAILPEMTIWGAKGGFSPHFFGAKSYFFSYSERHAKNCSKTPSGRKVSGRKKEKEEEYACAEGGPRFPIAHAPCSRKVAAALQAHMPAVCRQAVALHACCS